MASIIAPVAGGVLAGLLKPNTGLAAPPPQQNFAPQIAQANENLQSNIGNQNAFAKALQLQTQGGGPNLAQSLLSNATGENVANQAALMASQRGTGANAGLIARQAAQQGSKIQQDTAGKAAAIRQQQQLNAQQGLGNVYGQIGQESGNQLNSYLGGQNAQNQNIVNTNQINAGIGQANTAGGSSVMSGIGQALPGIANMFSSSGGSSAGSTPGSSAGYGVNSLSSNPNAAVGAYNQLAKGGPVQPFSEDLPEHFSGIASIYHPHMTGSNVNQPSYNASTNAYAEGGKVDAKVSPGEKFLKPKDVKKVAEGKADPMSIGETIPGKPKVPGAVDSYKNDTVSKKLETGGIVIPRHITQGKNPGKEASEFVMAIIKKQKKGAK